MRKFVLALVLLAGCSAEIAPPPQGAGYTVESILALIDAPHLREAYAEDFAVSDRQGAQRVFGKMRYRVSAESSLLNHNSNSDKDGWLFLQDDPRNGAPGFTHRQQSPGLFAGEPSAFRNAMLRFARTGDPGWPHLYEQAYARFTPELTVRPSSELEQRLSVARERMYWLDTDR